MGPVGILCIQRTLNKADELPFMHNLAAYTEEEIALPFRHSQLLLKGGLRSDMTFIPGTVYGTVSSLSPRFSAKYSFGEKEHGFFQGATLRAGWGKAVKLPSLMGPGLGNVNILLKGELKGDNFNAYLNIPISLHF